MALNQRTLLFICLALLGSAMSFVPSPALQTARVISSSKISSAIVPDITIASSFTDATTNTVAVSTLDPSTFLSDLLGGLLGSYAILAVPIVAALAVVGVIAFAIVSYANPADEDD
jgi:hypothetical protein